jgi:hypothetical protein
VLNKIEPQAKVQEFHPRPSLKNCVLLPMLFFIETGKADE